MPRSQPQPKATRPAATSDAESPPVRGARQLDLQRVRQVLTRWFGSLQFAVVLLPLFAFVLFLGTLMESWHDRRTAHQLIYGSWWFAGLLGLLGVNVVCAALKKRPWKRHQTGFLITHLGLITLVVSGLLTAVGGTSGVLVLVDSPEEQFGSFGLHVTDFVIDRDQQTIRVVRPSGEEMQKDFVSGPFAWGDADAPRLDPLTRVLAFLVHPWPHGWSASLGGEDRLEVLAYYPHTQEQPFTPLQAPAMGSFPALEFHLASPTTGVLSPRWVAPARRRGIVQVGAGIVQFLESDLATDRLAVFQHPAAPPPVGNDAGFEVLRRDPREQRKDPYWRDPRWQDPGVRGVLQFVTSRDGRLFYRSYSCTPDRSAFERFGEVTPGGNWQPIWGGMQFKMQVTKFLPHVLSGPHFTPLDHKPAREEELEPALSCRLTSRGQAKEFWLGKTDGGLRDVMMGSELFQVGYNSTLRKLGFELQLLRAEETMDPGSKMPASQSSRVRLSDPSRGIVDQEHLIRLNEPLDHAGYTIYQTGYSKVGTDSRGQPVGRSLLTVTSDPGLYLKYAGSAMVALGILCMFYMRAYFFGRSATP